MVVFREEWALDQGLEEAQRVDPDKDCRAIRDLGGEGGHAAAERRELRGVGAGEADGAGPICSGCGEEAGGFSSLRTPPSVHTSAPKGPCWA